MTTKLKPEDIKVEKTITEIGYVYKSKYEYRYEIELLHIPTNIKAYYSAPNEITAMTNAINELNERVNAYLFFNEIPKENIIVKMTHS